jgi:hypothetical protein
LPVFAENDRNRPGRGIPEYLLRADNTFGPWKTNFIPFPRIINPSARSYEVNQLNTTSNSSPIVQPTPVQLTRPAAPAKRGRLFYLGLVGVIGGAGCCLLSVILIVLSFAGRG